VRQDDSVTSLFQRSLGPAFTRMHPRLQQRFAMTSASSTAQLSSGVMTEVWRGAAAAVPVVLLGRARRLELPGRASEVPFELANYAYLDTHGRETFAYSRRFKVGGGRIRRFDDTMIFSEHRDCIVNYLGSHQDIAADIHCEVTEAGALRLRGGSQRFYQGPVRLTLPRSLAAMADVVESYDEAAEQFRISVEITSRMGRLFGYRGWFTVTEVPFRAADIPPGVRPDVERTED
jgi:hypothetical protein